jgi:hypothetical protein
MTRTTNLNPSETTLDAVASVAHEERDRAISASVNGRAASEDIHTATARARSEAEAAAPSSSTLTSTIVYSKQRTISTETSAVTSSARTVDVQQEATAMIMQSQTNSQGEAADITDSTAVSQRNSLRRTSEGTEDQQGDSPMTSESDEGDSIVTSDADPRARMIHLSSHHVLYIVDDVILQARESSREMVKISFLF